MIDPALHDDIALIYQQLFFIDYQPDLSEQNHHVVDGIGAMHTRILLPLVIRDKASGALMESNISLAFAGSKGFFVGPGHIDDEFVAGTGWVPTSPEGPEKTSFCYGYSCRRFIRGP